MHQATKPRGTSDEQRREGDCSVLSSEKTKEKIWSSSWQSLEVWSLEEVVSKQIRDRAAKEHTHVLE